MLLTLHKDDAGAEVSRSGKGRPNQGVWYYLRIRSAFDIAATKFPSLRRRSIRRECADVLTLVHALPWFLPGLAITAVIACAVAVHVGRRLRTKTWIAFVLIMSVGAVLAATLTPVAGQFGDPHLPLGRCDFGRLGPAPLAEYLRPGEAGLNVILFVPLGLTIGLLGRSPATARLLVGAAALPPVIEGIQSLLPMFGRGCQSADVVDNLLGMTLGLAVGALLAVGRSGRTGRR
jgi:hypothetical protein